MVDQAFVGAGKKAGLEQWRIEKLKPVKFETVTGKLHEGDSYIFLHTLQSSSGALTWNIHFWLGKETSQDESGICAYKTVELDESLGGGPVQYREVQGNESSEFISLFKKIGGLEYLPGGVDSGFKKVERDVYESRLLHVKGKRVVRVSEVPLSNKSLNTGDVFILDAGLEIYIYNGPKANRYEKAKGVDVASKIRNDERGGRANITLLDDDPKNAAFWSALGGYIDVTNPGEDDSHVESSPAKLWRITDESGSVQILPVDVPGGRLTKEALGSGDVYLVDVHSKVYVWIGKGASAAEKKESMIRATGYLSSHNLPNNTPIERVIEGGENAAFKSVFAVWDPPRLPTFGRTASQGVAKAQEDQTIDIQALLSQQIDEQPVDDGSGKLEVWRVEDFKRVPVDPALHGQFFGGDSYVLLYTYLKNKREEYIIYFWQGNSSSQDEKGASALLAKELDDQYGDRPVQVRVVQNKEPAHFRQLFKGSMIVHSGGKASGFKNSTETDSNDTDGVALFQVHGSNPLNTLATQVPESAANLNSADCFVLVTPETSYAWRGNAATEDELYVATNIAGILAGNYLGKGGRQVVSLEEGGEDEAFWAALGGKQEYPSIRAGEPAPRHPRLFQLSNATGAFRVEEIASYDQHDLCDEDVMLLDCYNTVYVWVGTRANETEKAKSFEFAQQFVASANDGRDVDTPIIRVNAGNEPAMFTSHFVGWDSELFDKSKFVDPYEAKRAALAKEKAAKQAEEEKKEAEAAKERAAKIAAVEKKEAPAPAPKAEPAPAPVQQQPAPVQQSASGTFSYEELKSGIPPGVDPTQKENYLSDADFQNLFGVSKAEFAKQPGWKKQQKKKDLGLF